MKLKVENYNPEIGHCPGGRQRMCTGCLRYSLYDIWHGLPSTQAEAVIMFPPKATRNECPNYMKILADNEDSKSGGRRKSKPTRL